MTDLSDKLNGEELSTLGRMLAGYETQVTEPLEDGRVGSSIKGRGNSEKKLESSRWELHEGIAVPLNSDLQLRSAIPLLVIRANRGIEQAVENNTMPGLPDTHPIEAGDVIDPYIIDGDKSRNYHYPFILYEGNNHLVAKFLVPPGMERDFEPQYDIKTGQTYCRQILPTTVGDLAGIPRDQQSPSNRVLLQIVHHFKGNPYASEGAVERDVPEYEGAKDSDVESLFAQTQQDLSRKDSTIVNVVMAQTRTSINYHGMERTDMAKFESISMPVFDPTSIGLPARLEPESKGQIHEFKEHKGFVFYFARYITSNHRK